MMPLLHLFRNQKKSLKRLDFIKADQRLAETVAIKKDKRPTIFTAAAIFLGNLIGDCPPQQPIFPLLTPSE
jgi:hypothetical protein